MTQIERICTDIQIGSLRSQSGRRAAQALTPREPSNFSLIREDQQNPCYLCSMIKK
jgi:hypothetical protein